VNWKKLSSIKAFDLKLFYARWDHYYNTKKDLELNAIVLEAPETTNVVAITSDNEMVMVNQFRFGSEKFSLEIPGGIVEEGESIQLAAERELREETGYTGDQWEYLGSVFSNPVIMDNRCHHYLLRDARKTHSIQEDSTEEIEVKLVSLDEIKSNLFGIVDHPHTISAICRAIPLDTAIRL